MAIMTLWRAPVGHVASGTHPTHMRLTDGVAGAQERCRRGMCDVTMWNGMMTWASAQSRVSDEGLVDRCVEGGAGRPLLPDSGSVEPVGGTGIQVEL
jgi:hypothetical protein